MTSSSNQTSELLCFTGAKAEKEGAKHIMAILTFLRSCLATQTVYKSGMPLVSVTLRVFGVFLHHLAVTSINVEHSKEVGHVVRADVISQDPEANSCFLALVSF